MTHICSRLAGLPILPIKPPHPDCAELFQPLPTLPPPRHHTIKLGLYPLHLDAVRYEIRAGVAIPLFRKAQRDARLEVVQCRHVPLWADDFALRRRRVGLHGGIALRGEDGGDGAGLKVKGHVDGRVVEAVQRVDAPQG